MRDEPETANHGLAGGVSEYTTRSFGDSARSRQKLVRGRPQEWRDREMVVERCNHANADGDWLRRRNNRSHSSFISFAFWCLARDSKVEGLSPIRRLVRVFRLGD